MTMKKILCSVALLLCCTSVPAIAATDAWPPRQIRWSFEGPLGTFDRQAAQRGFQVYQEVCSVCHGMSLLAFRNLEALGFSEDEVKALASQVTVRDGPNDDGEMYDRPGRPSDHFHLPYPNEQAARAANNGAYPPDLSLIIKARPDGANYVHSLLTGYGHTPPENMKISDALYYNPYFPGMQIAMTPPLSDGQVSYMDNTNATIDQMARDVTHFLQWAAEPEMEHRNKMGIRTILFLIVFSIIFYMAKCRIWERADNEADK